MRLLLRERLVPLAVLLGIGGLLPAYLLLAYGQRMVMFGTAMHFAGVGFTAIAAAVAALALSIVGARRGDGRVVLVGTAF